MTIKDLKVDNELPSVEDVVASLAERGVKSFNGDVGEDETPAVDFEEANPEVAEVELGADSPVDAKEGEKDDDVDQQAETLPEHSGEGPSEEEAGEPEKEPVPQPVSSAKYVEFLENQRNLQSTTTNLEKEKSEAEKRAEELEQEVEKLKAGKPKDPMEALMRAGYTYEDATKMVLQGWEPPEEDPVDKKIAPLQAKLDEAQELITKLNQKLEEREQNDLRAKAEAARRSTLESIKEVAVEDKYPHIHNFGDSAYELVNDVMVEYYQQYKVALDIDEACAIIEQNYEKMLSPALKSEKLRAKYGLSKEPKKEPEAPKTSTKERKTLTNKRTSGAPASQELGKMSDLQAQDEVAKMLRFND